MLYMLETLACGDGDALFAHVALDGDLLSEPVQQTLEGLTAGEPHDSRSSVQSRRGPDPIGRSMLGCAPRFRCA